MSPSPSIVACTVMAMRLVAWVPAPLAAEGATPPLAAIAIEAATTTAPMLSSAVAVTVTSPSASMLVSSIDAVTSAVSAPGVLSPIRLVARATPIDTAAAEPKLRPMAPDAPTIVAAMLAEELASTATFCTSTMFEPSMKAWVLERTELSALAPAALTAMLAKPDADTATDAAIAIASMLSSETLITEPVFFSTKPATSCHGTASGRSRWSSPGRRPRTAR